MNKKIKKILAFSTMFLLASCTISQASSSSTSSDGSTHQSDEFDSSSMQDSSSIESEFVSSSSSSSKATIDEEILSYGTYVEAAYGEFNDTDASMCKVEYKLSEASTFEILDQELIRDLGNGRVRFDAVGLKAGTYNFKITTSDSKVLSMDGINVTAADRSGYAFYNTTEGIGAYNQDGTLKSDAVVIYVTEETKNTVTANSKTGIGAILKANKTTPICVRFIGRVASDTRNEDGKYQGIYEKINGLSDYPTSDGTYYNELDVENCKNITLEGIGSDAEIFQWGFQFITCSSIEVKNLTFTDYTEDACGVFGDLSNPSKYQRYFIHNNHFNIGKNLLNDTPEKDKGNGDGATDVKGISYATYAYNSYYKCQKTGLVGGSDSDLTSHLTFHHNYYKDCKSRLPLGRRANMHYYNNLFEGTTSTCMDLRANAYVFSEANYFNNSKNPMKLSSGAAIKSYNDIFSGCSGTNSGTKVTSREEKVSNNCAYGTTFDTDPNNFYYDSENKTSNVTYLTDATKAKTDAAAYAGPGHINPTYDYVDENPNNPSTSSSQTSTSSSTSSSITSSSSSSSSSSSTSSVVPSGETFLFNASELDDGTYTSDFSVGIFKIFCATKNVSVANSSNYTSFDPRFTKALKLSGSGKKDVCNVTFELSNSAQVKIYAKGISGEVLEVVDYDSSSIVFSKTISKTEASLNDTILGAGKYYIRSTNSSIEIGAIEILYL